MHRTSDRISGQVRLAAVSLLAVTWGLLVGEPEALKPVTERHLFLLLIIGGLAMLCLALDVLQYVAGYLNSKDTLRRLMRQEAEEVNFNYRSLLWILRIVAFWSKQISVLVAILLWMYLVGAYISSVRPG